jgi:hypothetical protein
MDLTLAVMAGLLSSAVFVGSVLPMLLKAVRTRDLASYSLGNLLLANLGNVVHSVYVFSLPMGPIWALHSFYLLTSGFMLAMYLRHRGPQRGEHPGPEIASDALVNDALGNDVRREGGRDLAGRPPVGRPDDEVQRVSVL